MRPISMKNISGAALPARWAATGVHRSPMALLAAVTAAGALLRFYGLEKESLWYDEALSYWYTTQEYGYLWREVPDFEIHPPVYGIMLKWWVSIFGDGEAGLRGLSALASAAVIPLAYYLGRTVSSNPWTGTLAAAFIAFSPAQLYFAQEARPYAMLTLAAAIAMCGAYWMVENPARAALPWMGLKVRDRGAAGAWAALTLGGALAVWMHNMGALVLASLLVSVFPAVQWRLRGSLSFAANALLAACAILALWAPFLPSLALQSQRVVANFWLKKFTLGYFFNGIHNILFLLFPSWHFTALALALWLAGAWAAWKARGAMAAVLPVWMFLAPLAVSFVISWLIRPIFIYKTILWAAVPFYIMAAWGLERAAGGGALLRLPAAAALLFLHVYANYSYFVISTKEPWREIAGKIAAESSPGDVVLAIPNSASVPLGFYTGKSGAPVRIVPLPVPYPARWMDRMYPVSPVDPAMKKGDEKLLQGYGCRPGAIWLVGWETKAFDPESVVVNFLTARCGPPARFRVKSIDVFRFGGGVRAGKAGPDALAPGKDGR